jgi:hypothetical protein
LINRLGGALMSKLGRVFHHPVRDFVQIECRGLRKNNEYWNQFDKESIVIPIDSIVGNQDPYIFHFPWFAGYCRNYNFPKHFGNQSVIIYGTYIRDKKTGKESFFVDTVFVVGNKYEWLGKENGYKPSMEFRSKYPYSSTNKWYSDFIAPRVEYGQHKEAKYIMEAAHYNRYQSIPYNWTDGLFSFIPLVLKDGNYKLIDIFDELDKRSPGIFKDFDIRRNRLYNENDSVIHILRYLFQHANILVTEVLQEGSPERLNEQLNRNYKKLVYGLTDEDLVNNYSKCGVCAQRKKTERIRSC